MDVGNDNGLWNEYFDALEKRNYKKALSLIDKILESNKKPGVYVMKGRMLMALGRCEEALKYFDEALKINPK